MKISRNDGFTLIETLIVLSVVAIGLTLAVPAWNEAKTKRELVSASKRLSTFLSEGRSLATKHNKDVTVNLVYQDSTTWCVGMVDGSSACDCTIEDANQNSYCAIGGVTQILHANDLPRTELTSFAADTSFVFDRVRGTLSSTDLAVPHFFNFMSANGMTGLQVEISATGNIVICNWLESTNALAYRSCKPSFGEPASLADTGILQTK